MVMRFKWNASYLATAMITTLAVATLPAIAQAPFLDLVDSAAFEEVDSASDVAI